MALLDDSRDDTFTRRRHVLTTWGVRADDLERRLGQAGLDDAGVDLEVEVVADDGMAVRVAVIAGDEGRLNWGVQLVQAGVGDAVLGDAGATLEGHVVELLRRQGLTAGTAESLTSGAIAERLSRPVGAGSVFLGGIVSYAADVKHGLLAVPEGPVVTEDAAMAMAEGAARVLGADAAVAVTGVAGPSEMEGRPVGTVLVGSWLDGEARSAVVLLDGSPDQIRRDAASHALDHLRHRLLARERGRHGRG
jgi:PncC family amidohydrolase